MRIVFMGTPEFAVASLSELIRSDHEVAAVVTQPDRPQGRRMTLTPPPVKTMAEAAGIPVFQPETLRGGALDPVLAEYRPDIIVVAAYGRILPAAVLDFPEHGCINVHASLLPKYRGSCPIQWAIINGESETGVTIMHMDRGIDTGDMIIREETPIGRSESYGALQHRLAEMGGRLLVSAISLIEAGTAPREKQDGELATYAPMIEKELSFLSFTGMTAEEIRGRVYGLSPAPGAYTTYGGKKLKIFEAATVTESGTPGSARIVRPGESFAAFDGEVTAKNREILIYAKEGATLIDEVQIEGKKRMSSQEFLMGHDIGEGTVFE